MLWRLIIISILFTSVANAKTIGVVSMAEKPGLLERDGGDTLETELETPLLMMDRIETYQGAHRLTFIDDTIVDMTPQSLLTIDDYVYDPSNNEGSLNLKAKLGTIRYASGKLAKNFKQNA